MENRNFNVDEFFMQKLEEVKKEDLPVNKKNKKNKKGLIVGIIAGIMAGVTILTAALWPRKNNNKQANEPTTEPTTSNVTDDELEKEDSITINELGLAYADPMLEDKQSQYGDTTGDINKNDLVEKDGITWKDQEAADKSDDIGKTEIDDKDGTLEVKPNGDVVEKDQGYEVKDEDGNIKQEGTNEDGIPDGYAWDDVLGKLVPENEVGKYVYVDATYYASDGTVILEKGEIVLKETLEKAKKQLTTTKPEVTVQETKPTTKPEPTEPEPTKPEVTKDEGVINPDGTYTIYGITYKTKADYGKFVTNPEKYGYYNGIIMTLEEIEGTSAQATVEETKPAVEPTEPEVTKDEGVVNPDGTYTIYGTTYKTKADYQQFLLHPEQYGFYNGMVLSLEDIEALYSQNQKTK